MNKSFFIILVLTVFLVEMITTFTPKMYEYYTSKESYIINGSEKTKTSKFSLNLSKPIKKLVINVDFGGSVLDYLSNINVLETFNTKVEIRRICASACTMYLSFKNVCAHPYAIFAFHKPYSIGKNKDTREGRIALEIVTNEYLKKLPEYVHKYIKSRGGLKKEVFAVAAKDLGVPICNKYL